jgi:small redox-active disulfide protein 2
MEIKVLGAGCAKCHALKKNVKAAIQELGLDVEIDHITDIKTIAEYGVFMTPGLVVDGVVKVVGKVATKEEIKRLLRR